MSTRAENVYKLRFHGDPSRPDYPHPLGGKGNTQGKKNKSSIKDIVSRSKSKSLKDEFQYRLEGDYEDTTPLDILTDIEDWALSESDGSLVKASRRALIEAGFYREISAKELANTIVLGGSTKDFVFSLDGKKYILAEDK